MTLQSINQCFYLYPPALCGDDPGSDGDIELALGHGLDPYVVSLNNKIKMKYIFQENNNMSNDGYL